MKSTIQNLLDMGNTKRQLLVSFVGQNDSGSLPGHGEGAILTVFEVKPFDEAHLLWHNSPRQGIDFYSIGKAVKAKLLRRSLCKSVWLHEFECSDITDHNDIYPRLIAFLNSLPDWQNARITAAISSGTPAMQACWLLAAESGDFPLNLIRSNEKRWRKPLVQTVKLGAALPRIVALQAENNRSRQTIERLLPVLTLELASGKVSIGKDRVKLSPMQFAHYSTFALRAKRGEGSIRVSGLQLPDCLGQEALEVYRRAFPLREDEARKLQTMLTSPEGIDVHSWRSHISRISASIRSSVRDRQVAEYFVIRVDGQRNSTEYSLQVPPRTIRIVSQQ